MSCVCNCFFCKEQRFSLNKSIGLPGESSIIFEDENVFITPDIAPIIAGHFLIVSNEHITSFGNADKETTNSLNIAKEYIQNSVFKGQKILFFEHGAVIERTVACVDHAHIHVIPLTKDIDIDGFLKERVPEFVTSQKIKVTENALRKCAVDKQPYILYQKSDEDAWYYPLDILLPQFFRLMIALVYDIKKPYDWRTSYASEESKELFKKTLSLALPNSKIYFGGE